MNLYLKKNSSSYWCKQRYGAAIAVEMARQGFLVIGTATTAKGSEIITQMFELNKLEGLGLPMDVNSNQSISDLILKLIQSRRD